MDDALKCVVCQNYAVEAMESTCDCHLLYCKKCSKFTKQCMTCMGTLSLIKNAP
jgi:hypothetical protein